MVTLAELRAQQNDVSKLQAHVAKLNEKNYDNDNTSNDPRFWNPEQDSAGNAVAIIRFLPEPMVDGDDGKPFQRMIKYGLQGPGGWFIENSPATHGLPCPVEEQFNALWDKNSKDKQDYAKKVAGRIMRYYSNILVIEDPKHPENNGKVFLFDYGKQILDKITGMMNPKFPGEVPVNVFSFDTGAHFAISVKKKKTGNKSYNDYEDSKFYPASALTTNTEALQQIWEGSFSLKELIAPAKFKTYEALKTRYEKVFGATALPKTAGEAAATPAVRSLLEVEAVPTSFAGLSSAPPATASATPAQVVAALQPSKVEIPKSATVALTDDDDEAAALAVFKGFATKS